MILNLYLKILNYHLNPYTLINHIIFSYYINLFFYKHDTLNYQHIKNSNFYTFIYKNI